MKQSHYTRYWESFHIIIIPCQMQQQAGGRVTETRGILETVHCLIQALALLFSELNFMSSIADYSSSDMATNVWPIPGISYGHRCQNWGSHSCTLIHQDKRYSLRWTQAFNISASWVVLQTKPLPPPCLPHHDGLNFSELWAKIVPSPLCKKVG